MPVIVDRETNKGFLGIDGRVDAAGNKYVAKLVADRTANSCIIKITKTAPDGSQESREVVPEEHQKADDCTLIPSGADLHVHFTAHFGSDGPERNYTEQVEVIHNFFVPYANGRTPEGAWGANVPQGIENTGGGVTAEEVQAIVASENGKQLTALRGEFGGNIRAGIEDKARDGAKKALMEYLGEGTMPYSIWKQAQNIVYKVLKDNKVIG